MFPTMALEYGPVEEKKLRCYLNELVTIGCYGISTIATPLKPGARFWLLSVTSPFDHFLGLT